MRHDIKNPALCYLLPKGWLPRRYFTLCNLPWQTAMIRGVSPSAVFDSMSGRWVRIRSTVSGSPLRAAKCSISHLLLSTEVTVAPFSRNHFTACNLPHKAAAISGVQPSPVFDSVFGKWVWIRSVISVSPPSAAICNEFHPLIHNNTVAPFSRNHCTACNLPFTAATISSVQPPPVFGSMFGMWVWIRSMVSGSLPCAAKCNTFHPLLSTEVSVAPFSRNHCTACNLPHQAAIISGVQPSSGFDSMLGRWV